MTLNLAFGSICALTEMMMKARTMSSGAGSGSALCSRFSPNITVKADGAVTLETFGRGKAALQWLDRLKGKKMMSLIS